MKGLTAEAQQAKKSAQIARLAAKGSKGYSKLYASQPAQVRIAAEQKAARKTERAQIDAASLAVEQDEKAAANVFDVKHNLKVK